MTGTRGACPLDARRRSSRVRARARRATLTSVRDRSALGGFVCGVVLAVSACRPAPPSYAHPPRHPSTVRLALAPEPTTGIEYERRFEARVYELMQSPACAEEPLYAVLDEEAPPSVGGTYLGFCNGLMVGLTHDGGSELWGMGPLSGRPEGWEPRAFAIGSLWVRTELPSGVDVRAAEDGGVRLVKGGFDLRVRPASAEAVAVSLAAPTGCAVEVSGRRFLICREGRRYRVFARVVLGAHSFVVETAPRLHASRVQAGEMVRAIQLMHADVRR